MPPHTPESQQKEVGVVVCSPIPAFRMNRQEESQRGEFQASLVYIQQFPGQPEVHGETLSLKKERFGDY